MNCPSGEVSSHARVGGLWRRQTAVSCQWAGARMGAHDEGVLIVIVYTGEAVIPTRSATHSPNHCPMIQRPDITTVDIPSVWTFIVAIVAMMAITFGVLILADRLHLNEDAVGFGFFAVTLGVLAVARPQWFWNYPRPCSFATESATWDQWGSTCYSPRSSPTSVGVGNCRRDCGRRFRGRLLQSP